MCNSHRMMKENHKEFSYLDRENQNSEGQESTMGYIWVSEILEFSWKKGYYSHN